ncbi:transglycosylase domain-containing protein [Aestuariibius sp. HNIBRBA575]|uniref:transglycosylase domain-containing protein n=1 Tax=Aestuariibius sp. HNIBRBA575 TaxID=3233343 RepID=UPI0034A39B4A
MSGNGKKRPALVADRRYPKAGAKPKAKPKAATAAKSKAKATRKPARRKTPNRKPRGPIRRVLGFFGGILSWFFGLIWAFSWRFGLVFALIIGVSVVYVASTLPAVDELVDGRARGSVTMLDRDGAVFAWRGDQFGGMITAETVSPHLRNAVIATEDKRFYGHFGLSPRGIASAVRINLSEGRSPLSGHGGSTLTQQTAKLICLGVPFDPNTWDSETAYEADCRRTTLWRKVREAIYSMAMEVTYTKDEILTIYLNRAFLGAGSRGFEAASQRYFGISAANLNPQQSAMLAGLLKAPTRYAPTNNWQRSWDRGQTVMRLMNDQGFITDAQVAEGNANPPVLSEAAEARVGGYFADWVMSTGPEFFTRDTTEDVIIRTTLDQRIQDATEEAVTYIFDNRVRAGSEAQAAVVVMSADGAVRAMVGGRDMRVSGAFNRATQASRQTGSSFKPFVYATALELGSSAYDIVMDEPYCLNVPGSGEWCPKNYTREFRGPVSLVDSLASSLNVPAVRLSEQVGRENVRTVANQFGIDSTLVEGPSLALGASESTLLEMSGAYAGILNGGSAVAPYGLVELRLQGDDAPLMGTSGGIRERVIRREAAEELIWMMHRVVEVGSGHRAQIEGWEIAGKTGTTQAARDAWFIGFTADYVVGVWMGYDDNTPLTGVTGGGLPAEIWHETMKRVLSGVPARPLPMRVPRPPENVTPTDSVADDVLNDVLRQLMEQQ